jgi:hypothetical protein
MAELIDLVNEVQVSQGLAPQVLAATAQGSALDFENGIISTQAILKVGAVGANSTALNVQIEECATTNGTFTLIPGMAFPQVTTTGGNPLVVRGLRTQRYVRANAITITGTTPSFAADVTILAQKKYSYGASANAGGYDRSPSS